MRSIAAVALIGLTACAAQSKSAAPSASPASDAPSGGAAPPAYPATPSAQASTSTPADNKASLSPHAQAVQGATGEIESSQRELDVAAGDCRNACRALGSMDRAAGRLCGLTQGQPDSNRCDDAKQHVYTARDRVRKTCGQCDGGPSVDHDAPIPSLR